MGGARFAAGEVKTEKGGPQARWGGSQCRLCCRRRSGKRGRGVGMQAAMIDCEVELETGDLISLTQTGIGWPVRHSPAPHRDWNLPCLGNRVSSWCGVTRSAPLGNLQVKSQAFDVTWEQCVYTLPIT